MPFQVPWRAPVGLLAVAALAAGCSKLPEPKDLSGEEQALRERMASLAAVAGLMYLVRYGVIDFFEGFIVGVKAFTAAVLGGIGSLPGAMLGGLMIGMIEAYWSGYFPVEYKDVAVFAILVLVLIFRPSGVLGRPEIEKV